MTLVALTSAWKSPTVTGKQEALESAKVVRYVPFQLACLSREKPARLLPSGEKAMINRLRSVLLVVALFGSSMGLASTIRVDITSTIGSETSLSGYVDILRQGSSTTLVDYSISVAAGPFFFLGEPTTEVVSGFIYDGSTSRIGSSSGNGFTFRSNEAFTRPDQTSTAPRDLRFLGGLGVANLYNLALEGSFSLDAIATECFNCAPIRQLPVTLSYSDPAVIPLPAAAWFLATALGLLSAIRATSGFLAGHRR